MRMKFFFMLIFAFFATAGSGKEKNRRYYFRISNERTGMNKKQSFKNTTLINETIGNGQHETTEDSSILEYNMKGNKERKFYLSDDGAYADRFGSTNNHSVNTVKNGTEFSADKKIDCKVSIPEHSIQYFQSQLLKNEPYFIQFRIRQIENTKYDFTNDAFQIGRWYWTYNTSSGGAFPFLSWNLDYGLLTFGLLDARTIHVPYVYLNVSYGCNLTYGSQRTSLQVTEALKSLVEFQEQNNQDIRYRESYFCFLVTHEELRDTARYHAAQYLIFPTAFIRYKCCTVSYNYRSKHLDHSCPDGKIPGVHTWSQTSHVPFILGILLLAFCPIPMFQFFAWTAKCDMIVGNDFEQGHEISAEGFQMVEEEENWIYADGIKSPLTFFDLFSFNLFGLYDSHPVLTSRLRRLLCLLLAPSVIYIQIAWYSNGLGVWDDDDKISVEDLVKAGTPMGFLSLLADPFNQYQTFVPRLGGPLGITIMYYFLGLLFFVLPRCLKQIVEDGLPNTHLFIPSPLFLGYKEIVKMSKINIEPEQLEPGYTKGSTLMKCTFFLLFTTKFWTRLWRIQTRRIFCYGERTFSCYCVLSIFIFPLYVLFCIIEILLCLVYYGIPFCFFVVVMVKGATKALGYLRNQSRFLSWFFSFKILIAAGVTVVFILFSLLAYVTGLLFIKSFGMVSQVITLCFVSVIIYPSVSFGYLFFFVIVLYYFIKQIRNFSDVYTELLSSAVDISKTMTREPYHVSLLEGYLTISDLNCESLKGIRINGNILNDTDTRCIIQDSSRPLIIWEKNHIFGIPRGLFDFLVKKHRPVHQQILSLLFKMSVMICFVFFTLSISSSYVSGPTTEISEVMHVIFIVVVGIIPQLIEVAFSHSNSVLAREIEERKIEMSIVKYLSTK